MKIIPDTPQAVSDGQRTELHQKKQHEYRLVGKQRVVKGHTLFEIIKTDGKPVYNTRADIKQGCFYIQALNAKNAAKKLRKLGML